MDQRGTRWKERDHPVDGGAVLEPEIAEAEDFAHSRGSRCGVSG